MQGVLTFSMCGACDSFASLLWVSQQKQDLCIRQLVCGKVLPMSLLEDVLDVLRAVLEYFGVPPDMVSFPPFLWPNQACVEVCFTEGEV